MKKVLFILLLIFPFAVKAQNLVPNGDFEQHSGCPVHPGDTDSLLFWFNPATNIWGVSGTPDYFNQCDTTNNWNVSVPYNFPGYQPAHSGIAYCGIGIHGITSNDNWHEYIEVPLTSSLITNNCYHLEMYINCSNIARYTSDDIDVYFSDTAVSGINYWTPLPYTPQINNPNGNMPDTLNWMLVSANYIATGGESFIIIGNYKDNFNTTLLVSNNLSTDEVAYFYIDDVSLTLCTGTEEQNAGNKIDIYPNPFTDKILLEVNSHELTEIALYDLTSRKIIHENFINSISLNTSQLAKGVYIYEVRNKNGVVRKGKVVKE